MKNSFRQRSHQRQAWLGFSQPKRRNMFQRMDTFDIIAFPIFLFIAIELFATPFILDLTGKAGLLSLIGLPLWADGIALLSIFFIASIGRGLGVVSVAAATLAFNFFRK